MDCQLERYLLEGYVDGELSFERTLEVEAHLASCRACFAEVQSWKGIRASLQSSDLYFRAPAALEEKIRNLAPRESRPARASLWQHWIWTGSGAAFATAALLIAFFVARPGAPSSEQLMAQQLVSTHIRSMMASHLTDVTSTDQHTVKPWFDGKLDFAPPVRDLADQGFPLVGGRLDYLDNRAVAALVYHRRLHVINLFVWPAADSAGAPLHIQTIQGYNVLSWKKAGFEFRAVSDLSPDELRQFAQLLGQ
ncbi:MAG: anti-sigma factor family protein [Candidatus Acidiferrales bacterium]